MSLSAALHGVVATLRRRPGDLLPLYVLGLATPAIARVFAFAGLGVALLSLSASGRLGPAVADLASRDLTPPDPNADSEAFAAWADGIGPALEPLVTPAVVVSLAVGFLLTLLVILALGPILAAGHLATCHARLRGRRGLTAGIAGVRRHWSTFLGLYVFEAVVWAGASLGVLVAVVVGSGVDPLVGALLGAFAALVWLAVVAATRAVFALAHVAVVVDDAGLLGALRGGLGFLRRRPIEAVGYYLIAVGSLLAVSALFGALTAVGAAAVGPLLLLLVSPALDLLKTGLYADWRGTFDPPESPDRSLRGQLRAGLRDGFDELADFVRGHPGVNVLALALGVAGAAMGWMAAEPFVGASEASIVDRLADHVPPADALNYFGNNLSVALATAFSGIALAVPAALAVWFNGVVIGAVVRLEVDPATLAAFLVPHGIFELPAILVSGALGLHLGAAWWRTWRGGASRADLADALEGAFRVLVGVGVLLAAAALIEGFVSPYYWRLFL